jgi:RHS repeat-associated protein
MRKCRWDTAPFSGISANGVAPGAVWIVAQSYSYDKLNRVLLAEEPSISGGQGSKRSYNYDRWGNQWVDATNSSGINVYSATPTGSAWITPKNRINLSAGSYDRAGNQLSLPPYSAAYDADNRLTTMSSTLAYAYDGEGHRVKKVNGDLTTRYVYDALGKLAAEYAIGTPPSGAPQPECSTCYLTVDHLGSTRVLWDSAGVKGRYDYMPFGDAIPSDRNKRDSVSCAAGVTGCYAGSGSLTMRFTDKERDAETSNSAMGDGLDYFGARFFSGAQGRFTSPDRPFADQHLHDPQSWNLYSYTRNNPLRFIDDDGEAVKESLINKTYDVHGKTAAEASANTLTASGFKSDKSEPMSGLTSGGSLRVVNLVVQPSADGFEGTFVTATETVKSADVELNQTVTLPNWVERSQASQEDQSAWDSSVTGLRAHEQGHVDINREAAQKLDKSLPGTSGTGGAITSGEAYKKAGAQLTQRLNQKVRSTSTERDARQKQYDERTNHGRKKANGQED